jgi:tol-pal system protein YbgF
MSSATEPHGHHPPFVVAHRGASADRPEHTLAAYQLALEEGADGVECDVRLTLDGHLVCVHDRRVDRTSTGTGLVSGMTLAELKQFDWGAWHASARPDGNPGDTDLSPQAIYWVANISFIHQDYAPAARTFAEVIKKYPKSTRAPDAMLKLAQSFMGMGQKSEGCTTLGLIKSKYPNASPQTLAQAANLRKTACSK